MPQARAADDLRDEFLEMFRITAQYWDGLSDKTSAEKLDGLCFSVLNFFDGTTAGWPAMDLVMRPHPDDKQYYIDEGSDWIEDGTVINANDMLHELWHNVKKTEGSS